METQYKHFKDIQKYILQSYYTDRPTVNFETFSQEEATFSLRKTLQFGRNTRRYIIT